MDNPPETTAKLFCLDEMRVVGLEATETSACDHGLPRPSQGRGNEMGLLIRAQPHQRNRQACDVVSYKVEENTLQKGRPTPGSRDLQTCKRSHSPASEASEALCIFHSSL